MKTSVGALAVSGEIDSKFRVKGSWKDMEVARFRSDPDFRSAVLSSSLVDRSLLAQFIFRAHPPGPPSLIETWHVCKKMATEEAVTKDELYSNIEIEKKLRGPVITHHTCDVTCERRTLHNSAKQDTLKRELAELGFVYTGPAKRILEKLSEVFAIQFR